MKFNISNMTEEYFLNPVMNGDYADPSIVRDGDDFYMTHSSGAYSPGLLIWHSRDLVNWKPICFALEKSMGDIAAPEFIKYRDRFYIYYPDNGTNWVVTAERPEGPWSEPIDLRVGHIDPGHISTPEGERYLYLSDGFMAPLSIDGLSLADAPRKVYGGWHYNDLYNVEGFFLESPKLFFANGYYYMISAQGGTAGPSTAHMAVVARSESPTGPWENSPLNPLVHTGNRSEKWWARGHGTVIQFVDGSWWIVYHAYEKDYLTHGRKVLLEPVEWTEDGWLKIPEGISPEFPIKKPILGMPYNPIYSDEFKGMALGLQWRFFAGFDHRRYKMTGEYLVMKGQGENPGESAPMTCITGDYAYEVSVKVEIHEHASAGLILFYNQVCYCGIGLTVEGIRLYKYGRQYVLIPAKTESIYLKLVNDHHDVIPYYSLDGSEWKKAGYCFETSGYHHNAFDGYYSLRPGLFTIGNGYAIFRNFKYTGLDQA